jgi:hypothetical protein
MNSSIWSDYHPPGYVPDHSIAFFGADPAHSPAREARPYDACPLCGGAHVAANGRLVSHAAAAGQPDPVREYEAHVDPVGGKALAAPMSASCGCCGRTLYDGTRALDRATRTGDGTTREGWEAESEALAAAKLDKDDRTGEAVRQGYRARKEARRAKTMKPRGPR